MTDAARIEARGPDHKTTSGKGSEQGDAANPHVTYAARPDATPEGELAGLSAVYEFVIRAHEQKKAAAPDHERAEGGEVSRQQRQGQRQ
jgi:hypothetical protein